MFSELNYQNINTIEFIFLKNESIKNTSTILDHKATQVKILIFDINISLVKLCKYKSPNCFNSRDFYIFESNLLF
ncbi:hypothetical protein AR687_13705 [Flavobacteriaceae bacterium CRH]|nr:hypothetical protein AR687_13705 [Flavobacteriaceae bacterium CRH]